MYVQVQLVGGPDVRHATFVLGSGFYFLSPYLQLNAEPKNWENNLSTANNAPPHEYSQWSWDEVLSQIINNIPCNCFRYRLELLCKPTEIKNEET